MSSDVKEKDYSAKIYKIKHMTKKEWKAYKAKQKNKINSSDKEKANKIAKKLSKLKEARKEKKESIQSKAHKKILPKIGNAIQTAAKHTIGTVKQTRNEQKDKVKERMRFRNPFEGYSSAAYLRDTQRFAGARGNKIDMNAYMAKYNNIVT